VARREIALRIGTEPPARPAALDSAAHTAWPAVTLVTRKYPPARM